MQYLVSFVEGIITFISPCLLPMLPIYVSYFAGGENKDNRKTLLGAVGTYGIGRFVTGKSAVSSASSDITNSIFQKHKKTAVWLAPIPPIISNTFIIPLVLKYAYGLEPIWFSFITVFTGEFISCGILGIPLLLLLKKYARHIFTN